jgi:hypothetical protein
MMAEPMTVWAEVWPVAADDIGLWLLGGDDWWREGPIMADSSEHFEIELLLRGHGVRMDDVLWLHSTSWRPEGPRHMDTYIAAVDAGPVACERWPRARPIDPDLYDAVGRPPTHAATEEPVPRWLDVIFHGLGHLKDQMRKNATTRAAVGELWRQRLEPFEETLAGMYETPHPSAA